MRKRTRFLLWCSCLLSITVLLSAQGGLPASAPLADSDRMISGSLTPKSSTTTYYDLGCKHQGWSGYFDPQRWHTTADFGDGGVDVTEAPNATVAEGVTRARLDVQTGSSTNYTWRITVPADGYLYFRLEKIGSFLSPRISSTDTVLRLIHNTDTLGFTPLSDGGYFSPHLKAGDTFGIVFRGSRQQFLWEEFTFYCNSVGVIVKSSPPSASWIADEVKPIPRATVDQIIFTDDKPESWPLLDQDGDLYTLDDQLRLPLTDDDGPLQVSYQDQVEIRGNHYWVKRHFIVREPCSGNTLRIGRWWQPLPMIAPSDIDLR